MVVTLLLGSDKTTVSVATGQNDYYPLYLSIGNITNRVRRAHEDGVIVIGFLAIPKGGFALHISCHTLIAIVGEREDEKSSAFRNFRRQLFHSSLSTILEPIRSAMETPEVVRCPDGHFRRVIYSLGPYIADYPEQVLLSGIVSGWCPKLVNYISNAPVFCSVYPRCTAHSQDLDGDSSPRSREWTELMCSSFSSARVWDEYGIVAHVTVSHTVRVNH